MRTLTNVIRLGDAQVPGGGSDELYTGDVSTSVFSLDYYRTKITEFQSAMNAADLNAYALSQMYDAIDDESAKAEISSLLDEYEGKRSLMRYTAEAINAGASAINAVGGRMPELSIPSGLGFAQFALPAALIAAIGVAASLVAWVYTWTKASATVMQRQALLDAIEDPARRAQAAEAMATNDATVAELESTSFSGIASAVKWVAIGVLAFMGFKAWQDYSKR